MAAQTVDRPCIIGVQSCGCVTYANSMPDDLDSNDQKSIARIISRGGSILRTTVREAHATPNFMPMECPHEPKGWERAKPKPYEPKVQWKKVRRGIGDARRVYVVTPWSRGYPVGDARKLDGAWWVTEGWFNWDDPGANKGDEAKTPVDVEGPFKTQKAAGQRLAEIAMAKSRATYVDLHGEEAAARLAELRMGDHA